MPSIQDLLRRRPRQRHSLPVTEDDAGATLLARAQPESVLVEEKYRVQQEISRNSDVGLESGAVGRIEIKLPYDGHKHVTRATLDDVRRWATHHPFPVRPAGADVPVTEAQIGYLVVTDHQDTDLAEVTGRPGRTMAVPLRIPVRSTDLRDDDALVADRYTFRQEIRYHPAPDRPKLLPVRLEVEVIDPGSVSVPQIDPRHQIDVGEAVVLSQEYMTFRSYLELNIQVQVDLPGRKHWVPPAPVVRRISLLLPSGLTLTLSSVQLTVIDSDHDANEEPEGEPPIVHHNPDDAGVEWFDIPTRLAKEPKTDEPTMFRSPLMRVRIYQPGELFSERELLVRAHVETDDVLLSGAQARLFDARGRRVGGSHSPLTVRSSVTAEATVVLDDAFAKRTFKPQQSFHFDEVIPGPARVQDILSALADLRFEVATAPISPDTKMSKSQTLIARIEASRGDDEDAIRLHLFVLGRQHRTQRQSQHPGGRRYTSKLDTGDLTLVIFGEAPRDSSQLVHEVNALQLGLRDRFRRMKAQR